MNNFLKQFGLPVCLGVFGLAATVFFVMTTLPVPLFISIILALALIPLLFIKPEFSLIALIVARNLIDIFAQEELISLGSIPINLASLFGILIIPWVAIVLYLKFRNQPINIRSDVAMPLLIPWAVFLLLGIISVTYTQDRAVTLTNLLKVIDFFALYTAGYFLVTNQKQQRWMIAGLAAALIIPSLAALWQWHAGTGLTVGGVNNRVFGTFFHPNALGFSIVIASAALLMFMSTSKTTFLQKHISIITGGLLFITLILTFTRGAWIGAVLVFGLWLLLRKPKIMIPIGIIVILAVGGLWYTKISVFDYLPTPLQQHQLVKRLQPETDAETGSLLWRQRIWKETLPAYKEKPLLGYGFGTFPGVREPLVSFETDLHGLEAHNDYLRLLIELGIIGVVAYTSLFVFTIIQAVRLRNGDPYINALVVGFVSLMIATMVMSFADNVLRITPFQWMLWTMAGIVMASKKFTNEARWPGHVSLS